MFTQNVIKNEDILDKYNRKTKIIQKYIYYNIYKVIENNISNGLLPVIDKNLLNKIKIKEDKYLVIVYITQIYKLYDNYLYAILVKSLARCC